MAEFNIEAVVSPSSKMKRSSCFRFWPVARHFLRRCPAEPSARLCRDPSSTDLTGQLLCRIALVNREPTYKRCPLKSRIQTAENARYRIAHAVPPDASAVSSARMAMLSRSSASQRSRSRANAAAKACARCKAQATAASRPFLRRLYHVERPMPSVSRGCFAGCLGPMPCALRHRSERKRFFSRRSASVISHPSQQPSYINRLS